MKNYPNMTNIMNKCEVNITCNVNFKVVESNKKESRVAESLTNDRNICELSNSNIVENSEKDCSLVDVYDDISELLNGEEDIINCVINKIKKIVNVIKRIIKFAEVIAIFF